MSQPSFPDNPAITRDDAVNQILSSIPMEELALSHVVNAEGEKLQYVLGTLPGISGPAATIGDLLDTNESIQSLLQNASYNQLLLRSKMQQALIASEMTGPTGPAGAPATLPPPSATAGFAANTAGGLRCWSSEPISRFQACSSFRLISRLPAATPCLR